MDKKLMWRPAEAVREVFWHITHSRNANRISAVGIEMSADGQMGAGVYCIKEGSEALESVVELMTQKGYRRDELIATTFMYSGRYIKHDEKEFIYSAEGWCVIPENIPRAKILTVESIGMIYEEFGYTMDTDELGELNRCYRRKAAQHAIA